MKHCIFRTFLTALLLFTTCYFSSAKENKSSFARWQKAIDAFAAADKKNPTEPNGIVFVGSSSILLWDLEKHFPDIKALNRGFGGSTIRDSIHFADTLVLKHRPQTIVFYAGDNDIDRGNTAEQTHQDFLNFQEKVLNKLPDTKIIYIAIKPSIARWKISPIMHQANQAIEATCQTNNRLQFLDIWKPMLGEDGQPRPELFIKDGLHLNEQGYKLWSGLLRPHLNK